MASSPKSQSQKATEKVKGVVTEAKGLVRGRLLKTPDAFPSVKFIMEEVSEDVSPRVSSSESAEASMLQDIDAILSRLDNGIAKERKAMDDLFERIRRRAA